MKRTTTRLAMSGLLATGLLVPTTGSTQTQTPTAKQFFACYVPSTGTVYLIKQPGLRTACATGHVEFSWIDGGGSAGVTPAVVITDANGWAATGTFGSGVIPVTGPGVRLMWYPRKAAFRAGRVGTQWDDANVGDFSVALGENTTAGPGHHSTAMGIWSTATGNFSTAMGTATAASGHSSLAMGQSTVASGANSTALGKATTASGGVSTAMGGFTTASASGSIAIGQQNTASGTNCTAIGTVARCSGIQSTAMGTFVTASGNGSVALGQQTTASGGQSTAVGNSTTASGTSSTAMGGATIASGAGSTAIGTDASTNLRTGSFVYGDRSAFATRTVVQNAVDNEFLVRAAGGFRFRTSANLTTGCDISGGTVSGNLTCSGTIQSASGGFRFPDNTVQTTAATGGISAHEIVQNTCTVPVAGINECLANCPTGKTILGGGVFVDQGSASIFRTNPEGGVRWRGGVRAGTDAAAQMTTFAICAVVG